MQTAGAAPPWRLLDVFFNMAVAAGRRLPRRTSVRGPALHTPGRPRIEHLYTRPGRAVKSNRSQRRDAAGPRTSSPPLDGPRWTNARLGLTDPAYGLFKPAPLRLAYPRDSSKTVPSAPQCAADWPGRSEEGPRPRTPAYRYRSHRQAGDRFPRTHDSLGPHRSPTWNSVFKDWLGKPSRPVLLRPLSSIAGCTRRPYRKGPGP